MSRYLEIHRNSSIRLYFAGLVQDRERLLKFGQEIESYGHQIVSRWLVSMGAEASIADHAAGELRDVVFCDVFVLFNDDTPPTSGWNDGARHVAYGYALKLGKPIVVVGGRENDFHSLPDVEHVGGREGLAALLARGKRLRARIFPRPHQWLSPKGHKDAA